MTRVLEKTKLFPEVGISPGTLGQRPSTLAIKLLLQPEVATTLAHSVSASFHIIPWVKYSKAPLPSN